MAETSFILREAQSPWETVAFVFTDAFAGVHVGNAIVLSVRGQPLDVEHVRQTDRAGTQRTVPSRSEYGKPIHLYEIKPISDKELLQRLCNE